MPLAVWISARLSALKLRPWIWNALTLNVPPSQPNALAVSTPMLISVRPPNAAPRLMPPVALPNSSSVSCNPTLTP